ncbi:unnamed protein product [Mortierella alpina]
MPRDGCWQTDVSAQITVIGYIPILTHSQDVGQGSVLCVGTCSPIRHTTSNLHQTTDGDSIRESTLQHPVVGCSGIHYQEEGQAKDRPTQSRMSRRQWRHPGTESLLE